MDTWATAVRYPPWIEDSDGVAFNLAFQLARDSAHHPSDQGTDALRSSETGGAFVPSFHTEATSAGGAQDCANQ